MAKGGEAPELWALNQNMTSIKALVDSSNLGWFSDKLIEKGFIVRGTAQGIVNMTGVPAANQVGKLMHSVYSAIDIADNKGEKYDKFVDIFSHDAAYSDLAEKLRNSIASAETPQSETPELQDVIESLNPVRANWRAIGLALRLDNNDLKAIERQYNEIDDCLREMVTLWLDMKYNHKKYGAPSWEMLANAVEKNAGGANPSLAIKIRKNHGD